MGIVVVIAQEFQVHGGDISKGADEMLEQLAKLSNTKGTGVLDSAVDLDSIKSTAAIEITVEAEDRSAAIDIGLAAMRAAIHAAGNAAHVWPTGSELDSLMESVSRYLTVEHLQYVHTA
jgi:hypothetical protein